MKKRITRFAALISCILLSVAMVVPVSAQGIGRVRAYMMISGSPLMLEQHVNEPDYQRLRRDYRRIGKTARQVNEILLEELGVSSAKEGATYRQMLDAMETADSVRMVTQYVKVDAMGNQTALTKSECMREVAVQQSTQDNSVLRSPQKPSGSIGEVSDNGYMAMGILYIRTGTRYSFFGVMEWLITPVLRVTDAISFYCDAVSWRDKVQGNYGLTLEYEYEDVSSNGRQVVSGTTEYSHNSANPYPNGFYYQFIPPWDTNANGHKITYTKMTYTIGGVGDLKNNNTNSFNIYLRYAHRQVALSLTASIGWSTGEAPGVTIEGVLSFQRKYYDIPLQVK